MTGWRSSVAAITFLVHKDLRREWRARRTWPAMLLLGGTLVVMLALQLDLPAPLKRGVGGGLFWLAVFFAGTLALERAFAGEREEGCSQALRLYPLPPSAVFAAKLIVNFLAVTLLEVVLVPALVVLADVPLLDRPGPLVVIALLGNLGFAAVGTLLGALTSGLSHRGSLLALLLLPLLSPVLLAAGEATRSLLAGDPLSAWALPAQLLAVFAILFTTVGALVFEYASED